jgi:hypothetical protein
MVAAARADLDYAGVTERLAVVLADAGYWHQIQMQQLMSDGMQVLIPPDANSAKASGRAGRAGSMTSCAASRRTSAAASSTPGVRP